MLNAEADNNDSIVACKAKQQAAFEAERERWRARGQLTFDTELAVVGEVLVVMRPSGHNAAWLNETADAIASIQTFAPETANCLAEPQSVTQYSPAADRT